MTLLCLFKDTSPNMSLSRVLSPHSPDDVTLSLSRLKAQSFHFAVLEAPFEPRGETNIAGILVGHTFLLYHSHDKVYVPCPQEANIPLYDVR
jgi:hypothetical protein